MFKKILYILLIILCLSFTVEAKVKTKDKQKWCSLRSHTVNIRTGPGKRYPIKWIYKRKNMPMKVKAEHDGWIKIEDFEGTTGWVHPSMISDNFTFVVTDGYTYLSERNRGNQKAIAKLEKGVIGETLDCNEELCKVKANNFEGYVPNKSVWGCKSAR